MVNMQFFQHEFSPQQDHAAYNIVNPHGRQVYVIVLIAVFLI
jgi:hypothetical protein